MFVEESKVWTTLGDPAEFSKYLGHHKHYSAYCKFFAREIEMKGVQDTVNEYVLKGDERADDMFARLFGGKVLEATGIALSDTNPLTGFLHPLIHLGYAIEYSQPLLAAEALAAAAAHGTWPGDVGFPAEALAKAHPRRESPTLCSLTEKLRADPVVSTAVTWEDDPNKMTSGLIPKAGKRVAEILSEYTVKPDELERKTAEMINNTVYTAAVSQRPGKRVMFDFFLIHSVNTSIWFSVFLKQDWISDANKCRLLEWQARLALALYAGCRTPTPYPERVWRYVPKKPADTWEDIYARAVAYRDDGHVVKLIRALKNGEETSRPYDRQPGFDVPVDAFLIIAHMVMDSMERLNDPDFKQPPPDPFFVGKSEEVLRLVIRWVRWCGLEKAWDDVEPPRVPQRVANL